MGVSTTATLIGTNSSVVADECLDMISELEKLWSRFLPTSDITRLNNSHGAPMWVDTRTTNLIRYAQSAFIATNGAFNPTLLPLQIASGDQQSLVSEFRTAIPADSRPWRSIADIVLDQNMVTLPETMTLDLGGIAKGFTADLVCQFALERGATSACINIGGDMALSTSEESGWDVEIESPTRDLGIVDAVRVKQGGVATSSLNARERDSRGIPSHIFSIDGPLPSNKIIGATVIASTAAWAEAWTKYAIAMPIEESLPVLQQYHLAARITNSDGTINTTPTWKEFQLV
jgi:thiamine biosynthesis lipoprotein